MTRASGKIVHRDHWHNHLVEIIDNGNQRSLYFAGHVLQSTMSLSAPHRLVLSYTQYMMASLLINHTPKRVLMIGLGAGSLPRFLHHHFPACTIDVIEHSPQIIDLARGYFHLPKPPSVVTYPSDGYEFMAGLAGKHRYDLVLIDAFDENGMSPSIYNPEFFQLCREQLQDDGIVSINLWSGDEDRMKAVKNDISARFSSLIELPVPRRGNVVCLTAKNGGLSELLEDDHQSLEQLSSRFELNFNNIARTWRKHNLGFRQKIARLFS